MGEKSFLYFHVSAIILCIYYMILASALPSMEVSPDSSLRLNISSLLVGPLEVAKKDYVVWPDEPGNIAMASYIDRKIATIMSRDCITRFTSPRTGIEFWVVTANDLQAQDLSRIPYTTMVEDKNIAEDDMLDSSTKDTSSRGPVDLHLQTVIHDKHAREDLKVISWPDRTPSPSLTDLKSYSYQELGREGSYIYVIENGINPGASDFGAMEYGLRERDWHYAPIGVQKSETDDSPLQHGSCVASKAAGAGFGVSRESRLIILKAATTISNLNWGLYTARDDIIANNRQGRSVVLFAKSNSDPGIPAGDGWLKIRSRMKELFDIDAVVVNSAGNKATRPGRRQVDSVPQLWERADFPLIVAGAVDNNGLEIPESQGPAHVTAWAPGFNVGCVRGQYTYATGTSTSAGAVAGLVAYFLGLNPPPFVVGGGNTARNAKNFLQGGGSWQRNSDGPKNVVWNLEDGTIPSPRVNTSDVQKPSSVATS